MAFLGELQKVGKTKLRAVKTVDKSDPLLCGFSSKKEIAEYHEYMARFDAEKWVHLLGEATFETEFLPVSLKEAKAMVALCNRVECYKSRVGTTVWGGKDVLGEVGISVADELPDVLRRVDDGLARMGGAAFAKMSCRSAKDTITLSLHKEFSKRIGSETDDNTKLAVLLQTVTDLMRVQSGREVLEMFVLSERILGDLERAVGHPGSFYQNIVLRKWYDVDVGMEFRGFVSNNRFTALSQYNYFVYFPRVAAEKENIKKAIVSFWEERCREQLGGIGSYVIDFVLLGDGAVKAIEVNPFYDTTGAALFSWKTEKELLENGPFEFRVTTEVPTRRPEIEPEYHALLGWGTKG